MKVSEFVGVDAEDITVYYNDTNDVKCSKCNADLSSEAEDPWIAHEGCGIDTVKADVFVVCPVCEAEVHLITWTEKHEGGDHS